MNEEVELREMEGDKLESAIELLKEFRDYLKKYKLNFPMCTKIERWLAENE